MEVLGFFGLCPASCSACVERALEREAEDSALVWDFSRKDRPRSAGGEDCDA